ncbi:MAG TPA: GTP cyclohydrolase MptA [Candidatus Thermoplasmatota archaeon]|nr:GTP cyclohydrolase MptA [Candidatus Thermoplasmatota archaeon]
MPLPDVQNYRSLHLYKLTRVGVTGVVKPIRVARGGPEQRLVGTFDAFVDLPAAQRGIHMSRSVEAINGTIDALVREPTVGLEDLAQKMAETLLTRHDYATEAEVRVTADYFRERRTPQNDAPTLERYALEATAIAVRGEGVRKAIGVTVVGMTACPCAMEGSRHVYEHRGLAVPAEMPTITHNQRNNTTVLIEFGEGQKVEANDLIDIAEESLSAPTFELLKRGDETALVLRAHENPKFVEDVVREALARVLKRYGHLPDDTVVAVRSEAEESIHKHNAYAERVTTFGELRRA